MYRLLSIAVLAASLFFVGCSTRPVASIVAGDVTFHHLQAVSDQLGARFSVDPHSRQFSLRTPRTTLLFSSSLPLLHANGTPIHLVHPLLLVEGEPYLADPDLNVIVTPLLTPSKLQLQRVLIDPGHGGKDPGAVNSAAQLREKDLTLALARKLFFLLQQQGHTVASTRSSDLFVPLADRPAIADDFAADLFISLHFNASTNPHAHGIESFILAPAHSDQSPSLPGNAHDAANHQLAYAVHRQMIDQLQRNDRGIKHARFAVLRPLNCPGILIEGGFISNPQEAAHIDNPDYLDQLARAIADGIQNISTPL